MQRVNNRFDGRVLCTSRTYEYVLPAAALGLAGNGSQADEDVLERLRAALDSFVGDRPFHNYTHRYVLLRVRFR